MKIIVQGKIVELVRKRFLTVNFLMYGVSRKAGIMRKTFAALPVEAISTYPARISDKVFTTAPIKVVLPVPAYPFSNNKVSFLGSDKKSAIHFIAFSCSSVGW